MSDLISRQAAVDAIQDEISKESHRPHQITLLHAKRRIENLLPYKYTDYPTYSVKLWEGFEIDAYHKIPCRFHRWMMHVLLGWQFKIIKEDK